VKKYEVSTLTTIDLLDGLNPEQREAVQTIEGPLLVHAGPGSGKTRVIVHRIAYMVKNAGINPRHILAVTFSRKAAEEMKKRLDELFDQPPAVTVSTIHSACLRILRGEGLPGLGKNFDVMDEDSRTKLVKQCMEQAGLSFEENSLRRIKTAISYAKVNMLDAAAIIPKQGELLDDASTTVYLRYQDALKQQRAMDYDDMLAHTYLLFKENGDALSRYQQLHRYILVDEFQDTSSLQYQIIRMLGARSGNVCVVGDPDQTIYSWRQAEMRNTDNFRKDFPGTRVIGMAENYRSTATIVDAANALISRNHLHKENGIVTSREKGSPLFVIGLKDAADEAQYIARRVKKLLPELSLKNSDFAVLYRTNAQSRALEDGFFAEGLPYKLPGGTPFYKRKEVQDMVAWLRVMRNPADDAALTRVIRLAGKGIGAKSLSELQEQAEKSKTHLNQVLQQPGESLSTLPLRERSAVARFQARLLGLHAESRHTSLVTLMNRIIETTDYREHLQGEDNPEERWENLLEFISLAQAYEHLRPAVALSSLLGKVSQASGMDELGQEADAVTLNTLHGAKGLEFPVVFIAGVEEGLLPHSRSTDEPAKLEEERRLCYVGITRAMELAYLTYAEKRFLSGEISQRIPSRFLRELPANLVSRQDYNGHIIREASPVYGTAQPEPPQPQIEMLLNAGDKVTHPKFGAGRVREVFKHAADFHVIVVFNDYGTKKLLYSLAGLEKLL
jgi:DNA helicase-2/ATP-dependent DNA helicase PcrA